MDRLPVPRLADAMTSYPASTTRDDILVLGATGKTGRRIVDRLAAGGHPVRAASRSSAARFDNAVRFDWNDETTWDAALTGATRIYLALPLTPVPVHRFIERAVEAGAQRLVALSGRGADTWQTGFGQDMVELEQAVQASGVKWTILRASNFAQNFTEDAFAELVVAGEVALPVGGVPEPFVDVEDVADVAVALLTEESWSGRIVEVTGPESITWGDAVARIAQASGRDVRFVDLPPQEYAALLASQGLPPEDAAVLDAMFAESRRGLLSEPTDGVRDVLGRAPRPFVDYVTRAAAAGAWS
jgi:uncharacterized protein YbjT (DUF2867 family)